MDFSAALNGVMGSNASHFANASTFELIGVATIALLAAKFVTGYVLPFLYAWVLRPMPPKVTVKPKPDESAEVLEGLPKFDPRRLVGESKVVHLWDPSTFDSLGEKQAMSVEQVNATVARAKVAQEQWRHSTFGQRRLLMRTMMRFFTENQEQCARVAVRDSGKVHAEPRPR